VICARLKTKRDTALIAKAKRIRAKHLGIKTRKTRSSFQTNRDGPFRKKLNGTVERR
jgi:hypothetical protein